MSRVDRTLTRRELLVFGGGAALALALAGCGGGTSAPLAGLERDPDDLIDLPPGYRYRILSPSGSALRGGLVVPPHPDGMGTFAGPDGATVLVRNHELTSSDVEPQATARPYDERESGCTTAIVVDRERTQLDAFLTSSGTRLNCGGGATPWGSWLTCEEDVAEGHGYVFEVLWDDPESELSRQPIAGMGRFCHEAAAFDPETGVIYLTEDDKTSTDAPVSFCYRYLPSDLSRRPGALQAGGKLEALVADESGRVRWLVVDPAEAHADALRRGATRFVRLEGCVFSAGTLWFADTAGGEAELGQVFRYTPGDERLELVVGSESQAELDMPDNLAPTPWGEILAAEDGGGVNRLVGITPAGETYNLASVAADELAGPCFSPDGETLFVNLYHKGLTLAIWGPFPT